LPKSIRIHVLVDDWSGYNTRGALAEHGLSILVEARYGDGSIARVLLDTGQSGAPLINNARILGIDLSSIDAVALSHCHYDHSGGLETLARAVGRRVPLVLHPAALHPCYALRPALTNIGMPIEQRRLSELYELVKSEKPVEIAPGIYFLGHVPRYFEDLVPSIEGLYTATSKGLEPYAAEDDSALAIDVEGLGGVVVTGCSHSGVANIVARASEVLGSDVKAVVGGLHLVSSTRELIEATASKLRELGVEKLIVGHCTGFEAEKILSEVFKEGFSKMHSCLTISFP